MLLTKTMKTLKEKKTTKAQTLIVESKRTKTTMKHLRERKKIREQKMAKNNSKSLLSGKCDFDSEEILDKLLLFDLKKTSEEKIFDLILEKIPDKTDTYYIENRGELTHLE